MLLSVTKVKSEGTQNTLKARSWIPLWGILAIMIWSIQSAAASSGQVDHSKLLFGNDYDDFCTRLRSTWETRLRMAGDGDRTFTLTDLANAIIEKLLVDSDYEFDAEQAKWLNNGTIKTVFRFKDVVVKVTIGVDVEVHKAEVISTSRCASDHEVRLKKENDCEDCKRLRAVCVQPLGSFGFRLGTLPVYVEIQPFGEVPRSVTYNEEFEPRKEYTSCESKDCNRCTRCHFKKHLEEHRFYGDPDIHSENVALFKLLPGENAEDFFTKHGIERFEGYKMVGIDCCPDFFSQEVHSRRRLLAPSGTEIMLFCVLMVGLLCLFRCFCFLSFRPTSKPKEPLERSSLDLEAGPRASEANSELF